MIAFCGSAVVEVVETRNMVHNSALNFENDTVWAELLSDTFWDERPGVLLDERIAIGQEILQLYRT